MYVCADARVAVRTRAHRLVVLGTGTRVTGTRSHYDAVSAAVIITSEILNASAGYCLLSAGPIKISM